MPRTEVVYFAEADGSVPALDWLRGLPEPARVRFLVRLERLGEQGSSLQRPEADFLRDGIYELRVRHRRTNYRMLYFFASGRAVLCHGLTKESEVPEAGIRRALQRRSIYAQDPDRHAHYKQGDERR